MTPKQKAEELLDKMKYPMNGVYIISHIANELALIAVNEQIELLLNLSPYMAFPEQVKHLQEVKHEIEKL
jgi:hypothetical protein